MPGHSNKKGVRYVSKSSRLRMKKVRTAALIPPQGPPRSPELSLLESESPELPPLQVEVHSREEEKFRLYGRRMVDLGSVLEQIFLECSHGAMSCGGSHFEVTGEVRHGLKSDISLKCRGGGPMKRSKNRKDRYNPKLSVMRVLHCILVQGMCNYSCTINTDREPEKKMDVNLSIMSGAYGSGIGYSTLEETFSAADVPFMSTKMYYKCQETLQTAIFESAALEMQEAAAEEARMAIELGDVDFDGVPLIAVVVDGSWAKRSYKTKYDSLSGAAVIVGCRTKKVLFLGVKNKYCLMCERHKACEEKSKPDHSCFKNWTGSSTSMESAIILEGFQQSEELYGIRFNRLIADGDSSVYMGLIKNRPYKNTPIKKIECLNHLLRNLCRKIRVLSENRSIGTAHLRRIVGGKVKAIRVAINMASKHWAGQNNARDDRISCLRKDIRNAPYHVFGHHSKCAAYFCSGPKSDENDLVESLRHRGMWYKIDEAFTYLARHSESLLERRSNNLAESFNSVVAKTIGGKRINYCLRGSYQARCFGAVVSANSRVLQSRINKTLYGRSPGKFTKLMERRRLKRLENIRKAGKKPKLFRKLFPTTTHSDSDYGPNCQKLDLEPEEFEKESVKFLESLKLTQEEKRNLEFNTRDQSASHVWTEERRKRLTASNFGLVCRRKKTTKCSKLVERLLYQASINSKAIEYGKYSEEKAVRMVEKELKINVTKCGLFIDEELPFLGASPDGLVGEEGLLEVKCPFSVKDLTPEEAILKLPYFDKNLDLNKKHPYYYQVQGQLGITKKKFCLFAIFTNKSPFVKIVEVKPDENFWIGMKEKLSKFYMDCVLPELVDPRRTRSMPIREPYEFL